MHPSTLYYLRLYLIRLILLSIFVEAVNLELVNLNKTPTTNGHRDNGIPPKKKDTTEVVIGNSYNEYFVPVNEHKKYMR